MTTATISARTADAPYDNGIYRPATPELPAATITLADLPAYCGRMTDMGRDQRCRRLALAYQLRTDFDQIADARARHGRLRRDFYRRNLAGWVAFAQRRLAYYLATWELPECACGDRALAAPTHDTEAVLPDCTC